MAVPEEDRFRRTLRDALDAAGRTDLPSEPEELLRFVEGHLASRLEGEIASNLLVALTEDLSAEMDQLQTKGPANRSRMGAATLPPPARALPTGRPPSRPLDHGAALKNFLADRVKTPFPELKRSVAPRVRGVPKGPAHPGSTSFSDRPTVFLVESDSVVRASIARSLVSAPCDVRVMDSMTDLLRAVQSADGAAIAIVTVDGFGVGATLQALAGASASLRILARTDAPAAAEGILTAAGVRNFGMLSKAASGRQLVEAVRILAGAPAGVRPA
jgi:hypothetical protein